MFQINRFIRSLFKFLATIVSVLLPAGAFAALPAGVLDDTHAAVRAVMTVPGEGGEARYLEDEYVIQG